MRVLSLVDPRRVALLLVPVLLAAGAAQPQAAAPRAGAVLTARTPVLLASTPDAEAAPVQVHAALRQEPRTSRAVVRTVSGRAPRTAEQRGREALQALAYDPTSLGYRVRFLPYVGGALGTTNRPARLITVYVRPGQSELVLRTTIAHELGHALDFTHGSAERRAAYVRARGLRAGMWFPCDRCDDLASPAGDFAEVFALWLAGPGDFRSRLAGPPDAAQLRELAPLLRVPAAPAPEASPSPSAAAEPEEPERGLAGLLGPPASPAPDRR